MGLHRRERRCLTLNTRLPIWGRLWQRCCCVQPQWLQVRGAARPRASRHSTAFPLGAPNHDALLHRPAGLLYPPADVHFLPAPAGQAIEVATERQLRAALGTADLGWRDRRAVQLTADIQLSATLVISSPVRLQGNCANAANGRCTLRGTADGVPLVHVAGPAAVVELANLELVGGVGTGSLAGGLTASNHSMVDLVAVRLAGNAAASGGAARVDTHARLALTGCELVDNAAQVRGHGVAGSRLSAAAALGCV